MGLRLSGDGLCAGRAHRQRATRQHPRLLPHRRYRPAAAPGAGLPAACCLLPADQALNIHAVSGYSGGGRARVQAHEGPEAAHAPAFQVYGLPLEHKHTPEIAQHAGLSQRPFFLPSYGAFRQGIVLTIGLHLRQLAPGTQGEHLHACLQQHYADATFVEVMLPAATEAAEHLDPQALNGTNRLRLGVFSNARHGQVLLTAVFDNLGKGASGAAVQNLDLMLARRTY